jgi:predicted enzyme related to lactoylglutathione lyase
MLLGRDFYGPQFYSLPFNACGLLVYCVKSKCWTPDNNQTNMDIRLLVLRTGDAKKLVDFYSIFGLTFEYHKHGSSPYHYSATITQMVLEIYPLSKNQIDPDKTLRLGFGIDNFDETVMKLKEQDVSFVLEPTMTEFGFMAIVLDPDERKIELYRE